MPRTTGVDILNIKPDAEMGLAQNTSIPVPAVALDQINKANDDLRMFDHQKQIMKYDHDLKNQDNLLKGLAEDAVAVGNILPEDMVHFKNADAEDRKAFLSVKSMEPDKNGQNKEYDDYVRKHQHLKDVAATLQAKYVAIQKLRDDRANAILPDEQKALDAHLATEIKRLPGDPVRPYQKAFTMDLDKMIENAQTGAYLKGGEAVNIPATTTKETTGPKGTTVQTTTGPAKVSGGGSGGTKGKGGAATTQAALLPNGELPIIVTEPDQKWDYKTMLRNTTKQYVGDEAGRVNQQRIYDIFQGTNADIPKNVLQEWNKRLGVHDQANGIESIKVDGPPGPPDPNNPGSIVGRKIDTHEYPNAINYRLVGDKVVILDDVPTFNAKVALANVKGDYLTKGAKRFDEDAFKLNMEKAKNKADILLKGAQAQEHRAKGAFYYKKIAGMNADKEQEKVINDGYKYNLTTQPALAVVSGSGYNLAKIPGNQTTPIFTWASKDGAPAKPVIIKPIGSKPIYGTDPKNTATHGKVIGYEGGHYDQQYIYGGQPQSATSLWKMYQKFKTDTPAWNKGFDDYLKEAINADYFDVKIIGENGSTDRNVHTQALKAISNAASKKGQDQPFYESFNENE